MKPAQTQGHFLIWSAAGLSELHHCTSKSLLIWIPIFSNYCDIPQVSCSILIPLEKKLSWPLFQILVTLFKYVEILQCKYQQLNSPLRYINDILTEIGQSCLKISQCTPSFISIGILEMIGDISFKFSDGMMNCCHVTMWKESLDTWSIAFHLL